VELAFQRVDGVVRTDVGYTQGHTLNPTYKEVKSGTTGHVEAVRVHYNPAVVTYAELLSVYWDRRQVGGKFDPTMKDRQGNDRGTQYRSGIYYHNAEQQELALLSLEREKAKLGKPWQKVYVEVIPAGAFYLAEERHQQYLSEKGGRKGLSQSSAKGVCDDIRCTRRLSESIISHMSIYGDNH